MKLSKTTLWFIFLTFLSSAITGLLIFSLKKWGVVEGLLGPESHPWLYFIKSSHYMLTPFLVFMLGSIYKEHIKKGVEKVNKNKKTGLTMLACFIILMISGQMLLYLSAENIKYYVELIHLIFGIIVIIAFFIHSKKNMFKTMFSLQ